MTHEPSHVLGLVCEGPSDLRTVKWLVERFLSSKCRWAESLILKWQGLHAGEACLEWKRVKTEARRARIRIHGRFQGEHWRGEAATAIKALRLFKLRRQDQALPHCVVFLVRDTDGDLERVREGLENAREDTSLGCPVVLGIEHPNRECWVLAGFEPQDDDEQARLDTLREELGFDPTEEPERLDASSDGHKKSSKRVLGVLLGEEPGLLREERCHTEPGWDELRGRGEGTGLVEFLDELEELLLPVFTGQT